MISADEIRRNRERLLGGGRLRPGPSPSDSPTPEEIEAKCQEIRSKWGGTGTGDVSKARTIDESYMHPVSTEFIPREELDVLSPCDWDAMGWNRIDMGDDV